MYDVLNAECARSIMIIILAISRFGQTRRVTSRRTKVAEDWTERAVSPFIIL